MTEDVGQARLKTLEDVSGFFPGQLGNQFSRGGVSEIDDALHAEILSMEDFKRAEENLGRTPDNLGEIELSEIMASGRQEHEDSHHTFLYSQKETSREQNGGSADANVVTDIGRLKIGVQDPNAYIQARNKKENEQRQFTIALQQQLYLDQLYARMDQLNREIEELTRRKAELENDLVEHDAAISELKELEDSAEFLNDDSEKGREARQKYEDYLQRTGRGSLRDFMRDGRYDTDRLGDLAKDAKQDRMADRDQTQTEIDQVQSDIDTKSTEVKTIKDKTAEIESHISVSAFSADSAAVAHSVDQSLAQYDIDENDKDVELGTLFQTDAPAHKVAGFESSPMDGDAFASIDSDAFKTPDDAMMETPDSFAFASADSDAFETPGSDAFETAGADAFMSSKDVMKTASYAAIEATEFETVITLNETYNSSSTVGSFAGSGEEVASVLTSQFAAKAALVDEAALQVEEAKPAPDTLAKEDTYEVAAVQSTMGMGVKV